VANRRELDRRLLGRVLEPSPVVLVTSIYRGQPNMMTAAWLTTLGNDPARLGLAIMPGRLTHEFISRSEAFGLSVMSLDQLDAVHRCGTVSGRDEDKFATTGLLGMDATEIEAPLIEQGVAWVECGLVSRFSVSDHDLFVGEVLAVSAIDELFSDRWRIQEGSELIHHIAGAEYTGLGKPYTVRLNPEDDEE